jgi:hypothetical protein
MSIPISNVSRRQVFSATGQTTFTFTFEILDQDDIKVFVDDTLKEISTDYSVSINPNGTGLVQLNATAVGAAQVSIVGNRTIERTSDFTTGGDLFANTLNTELDSLTIFAQQNAEGVERALKAPETDPTGLDMTLPRVSDRANKYLGFNSAGQVIGAAAQIDINAIAELTAEITALGGLSSEITSLSDKTAELTALGSAGMVANISAVGTIASNIPTVAAMSSDISNLLNSTAEISVVAGLSTAVSTFNGIGTADISTVAGYGTAAITQVAALSSDVTSVASMSSDITGVLAITADLTNTLSHTAQYTQILSQSAEITQVASQSAEITQVFTIRSDVTTAATNASAISSCALNISPITNTSNNMNHVTAVSTSLSDIQTVASAVTAVNTVATNVSATVTFANTWYGAQSSDPTGSINDGSLYYKQSGSTGQLMVYNNNAWSDAAFEISSSGVLSFESRTGHINLQTADITGLGTAVYTGIVDSRFTTDAEAIGFSLVFGS